MSTSSAISNPTAPTISPIFNLSSNHLHTSNSVNINPISQSNPQSKSTFHHLGSHNPSISMADSSVATSPRISFSHDLGSSDIQPEQLNPNRLYSPGSIDFAFCVGKSSDFESSSSADELFSHGMILPTEIKNRKTEQQCSVSYTEKTPKTECLKNPNKEHETQSSKSFWGFKRSSSLNCSNGYASSLCSLQNLSRSNSTGSSNSVSNGKRNQKQDSQKHVLISYMKSSSLQKPPLKKNYGAQGNNSIRVSPVLNVGNGSLFGFGSIFSNGKDKNRKK